MTTKVPDTEKVNEPKTLRKRGTGKKENEKEKTEAKASQPSENKQQRPLLQELSKSPFVWVSFIGVMFMVHLSIMSVVEFMGIRLMTSRDWQLFDVLTTSVLSLCLTVFISLGSSEKYRANTPMQFIRLGTAFLLEALLVSGFGFLLISVFRTQYEEESLIEFDKSYAEVAVEIYFPWLNIMGIRSVMSVYALAGAVKGIDSAWNEYYIDKDVLDALEKIDKLSQQIKARELDTKKRLNELHKRSHDVAEDAKANVKVNDSVPSNDKKKD